MPINKEIEVRYYLEDFEIDFSQAIKVETLPGLDAIVPDRFYIFKSQGYHPFVHVSKDIKIPEIYRQNVWPWIGSLTEKVKGRKLLTQLKPWINPMGYCITPLAKKQNEQNSPKFEAPIHTIVAKAFIDNLTDLPYVDHIDGNYVNYLPKNLRWVSAKENAIGRGASDEDHVYDIVSRRKWFTDPAVTSGILKGNSTLVNIKQKEQLSFELTFKEGDN